jgi:hypothetical protein
MIADQLRRAIRAELHTARCRDKDHGELRLWQDARDLDSRMVAAGFEPKHATSWGTAPEWARGAQSADLAAFRLGKSTNGPSDNAGYQSDNFDAIYGSVGETA